MDQVCGDIELNPGLKTKVWADNAQSIYSLNRLQAIDVDSNVARAWVIKSGRLGDIELDYEKMSTKITAKGFENDEVLDSMLL